MKKLFASFTIATLLMPVSAIAQAPLRIGAAGAVAGRVEGALEGAAAGKVVESGQPLFQNEKISTNADGRLQVLLKDETVFTIGPNSSMVLDKFVYNPQNDSGTISIAVKGFFRFVTGRIARRKPSEMEVKMPVGVIGIRGTMVAGEATEGGSTVVLLGPGAGNNAGERIGQAKVSSNGKSAILLQPGSAVKISQDGKLGPVFKISTAELNGLLAGLANKQGNDKGKNTGVGGGSGSDKSGQTTGKGLGNANDTENDTAAFDRANNLLNTINGTQIVDGPATWDQVRAITVGQGTYVGQGSFTATRTSSGFTCVTGCTGTLSFSMDIDFGARTFGGPTGSNFITFNTVQVSGTTNINPTSFSSLTGAAVIPNSSFTNSAFNGTSITLSNSGGTVAKQAAVNVQFLCSGGTCGAGSGSVTGTR